MSYIDGFVLAVPTANRQAFTKHASDAAPLFREFGATRIVETWGDDVKKGELNDLYGAVQAKDDETVVFSWIEYPDKATRDAAGAKMMSDPRMAEMGEMPFDGKRMIFAGFDPLHDVGAGGATGYVDGVILPVPHGAKDEYRSFCKQFGAVVRENGATRVVDGWGDDIPDGKVTDFKRAAHAADGETVVFSWIEWPSKQARDAAWEKMMSDSRLSDNRPFDGKRMIFGGFTPVVDA
jgi:uncharacterized protein YbaA (DUF1428 family)